MQGALEQTIPSQISKRRVAKSSMEGSCPTNRLTKYFLKKDGTESAAEFRLPARVFLAKRTPLLKKKGNKFSETNMKLKDDYIYIYIYLYIYIYMDKIRVEDIAIHDWRFSVKHVRQGCKLTMG